MEIHPIAFVGAVVIPVIIMIGIVIWTLILRKKSAKNQDELFREKERSDKQITEIKLWEKLVNSKEKHIDVLQDKLRKR